MPAPAGEGILQVIPTLEDIIRMLLSGECTQEQARAWLDQHESGEAERRREDRKFIATQAMQGMLANPYYAQQLDERSGNGSVEAAAVYHADALLAELEKQ